MNITEDRQSSLSKGFNQLIIGFSAYISNIYRHLPKERIIQMTQEFRYIIVNFIL